MSVALKHLNEIPPPPSMYNPDLPPAVERVIMRSLEKDPTRRYATGEDLVLALEQAFETDKPAVSPGTPMVADLLESRPRPPDHVSNLDYTPLPRPSLTPAAPEAEPPKAGLAGRFARRQAEKEVEHAITEGLALDDDSISKLLEKMPDPSEIGLVGEGARGITLPEPPWDRTIDLVPKPKRRSRVGLLLALILIIVVLAAGWWLGTQGGKDKEEPTPSAQAGTQATAANLTQTAVIAQAVAANATLTAAVSALVTPETPQAALTNAPQPSRTPVATATRQTVTAAPSATPTQGPSATTPHGYPRP